MRARMRRAEEPTVDVKLCLVFPHEALSVPVMRRVLGDTLRRLGADEDGVADLLLAVTEACTNVIRNGRRRFDSPVLPPHRPAWRSVHYPARRRRWAVRPAVRKRLGRRPPVENQEIATLPESGRGLAIMRACVDDVTLSGGPGRATVVSLQKRMEWRADAPLVSPSAGQLRNAG